MITNGGLLAYSGGLFQFRRISILLPYRACNTSDSEAVPCLVITSPLQDTFMQNSSCLISRL